MSVFQIDGATDTPFLRRVFGKLLLNFTWWLNREDPDGRNVFGGGFLGLDNISPIDRSSLPPGIRLAQADGTAWMAFYSLAMLVLAARLAQDDPVYDDMVVKFAEQYLLIIDAIDDAGMYDAADGWFYDQLFDTSGARTPIEVQTLVGAIPVLPAVTLSATQVSALERLRHRFARLADKDLDATGRADRHLHHSSEGTMLSVVDPDELRRTLRTLFDVDAFLSPHGLRSLSKKFTTPYQVPGIPGATIDYEPAELTTAMYGGNSNWRGPVWFPVNYLVIGSLQRYHQHLGPSYTVEYPTGSGRELTLLEIASDLADRLVSIWLPGPNGRRPVYGGVELLHSDPAWQGLLWFNEYFEGDDGAGLGAMHQTGWTALVIDLLLAPPGSRAVG